MLRKAAGTAVLLLCGGLTHAQDSDSASFMAQLREASSAVAPLRMREKVAPRVLTGKFSGDSIDSLVITDRGTAFCKGAKPDPRTCQPINGLSASGRTVPVTDENGRTVLLQFEGMTQAHVCSINAAGFRASLDCRALDARKFPEYRGTATPDGKALMLDATDGKYLCTEAGGTPTCLHILDRNGQLPQPKTRKQQTWQMKPAALFYENEWDTSSKFQIWEGFMYNEIDRDCLFGACGFNDWWISRWDLIERDPRRDRCLEVCDQQRDAMLSMCAGAAGIACIGGAITGGPVGCVTLGGAVGTACLGGGGMGDLLCRSRC